MKHAPLHQDPYIHAMRIACAEARKWLGSTSPNPPVGAVALDEAGMIIDFDAHHRAGELHAEAKLLQAHQGRKIDTLCITLEPCNHHGRTPPCTEAIIRAGIKRVVIGARDPNPHVKGGGIDRLQQAGIEIVSGVNEDECQHLIHAFAYQARTGKPWITIKRAFTSGGSMIPPVGHKTFTTPASLRRAHQLRKKSDAIITGSGTILADNPAFTVRHAKDYADKKRWLGILDRRSRVPKDYLTEAAARGFIPVIYQDIQVAIADLTSKGAQDILIEAGPSLSQAFLDSGLWVMQLDVQQGDPDCLTVAFNPNEALPFDALRFNLDFMLPDERPHM